MSTEQLDLLGGLKPKEYGKRWKPKLVSVVMEGDPLPARRGLSRPTDVAELVDVIAKQMRRSDREQFMAIHLDARNCYLSHEVVSVGSLNASLVHPREVFKAAILASAASVICVHNHPSGEVTPSKEDIELTRRMVQAGEVVGIEVLDHVILGPSKMLSLKEANLF